MREPNFFVVGAPKCGTTSLYSWLKLHPQVFLSPTKEPHFFADQRAYRVVETIAEYRALFKDAPADAVAVGEASTTYLQTPGALENVKTFAPGAKIVIAVRNPVDMVQSLHGHMVFYQNEDILEFEQAWRASFEREQDHRWPKVLKTFDKIQVTYTQMGLLGKAVAHTFEVFPREQVHVIVFDDIKNDPRGAYLDLEAFLGLRDDGRTSFEEKNVARTHGKGSIVSKLVTGIPAPVAKLIRKAGIKNTGLGDKLVETFAAKAERVAIAPELRAELVEYYRDDVRLLGEVLGRDLGHWVRSPA